MEAALKLMLYLFLLQVMLLLAGPAVLPSVAVPNMNGAYETSRTPGAPVGRAFPTNFSALPPALPNRLAARRPGAHTTPSPQ